MASVDSGVETENDSNDSSVAGQENRRSMDQSPASTSSLRDSRSASENSFFSFRDPMPSTSHESSSHSSSRDIPVACVLQLDPKKALDLTEKFKNMIDARAQEALSPPPWAAPVHSPASNSPAVNRPVFTAGWLENNSAQNAEASESSGMMILVEPPAGLSFNNVVPTRMQRRDGNCFMGYETYEMASGNGCARDCHSRNRYKAMRMRKINEYSHSIKEPMSFYYERNLRRAVSANNVETVETLLSAGVNPNASDEFKRAPLHLAACRGYMQILQLLLDKGANPNQKDSMGNTALHLAACTNNVPVVTLLLKAGTDVCSLDQYGRNPLQLAQTRLKMLQATAASNPDAMQVKSEVQNVIDMMQIYLHRIGSQNKDAENELLNSFSTRLTLSQTSQEVDHELRGLLASLTCLNIGKSANSGLESIDI